MYETRSSVWVWVLVALLALAVVGFFIMLPVSDDATQRAQYSLQTIQAQENGQTERVIQEQQTQRHAADLRAESTARLMDYTALLLSAGLVVMGVVVMAGGLGWGLIWTHSRLTQHNLLLLERERQAALLQAQTQLYLPREFDRVEKREIVVVEQKYAASQDHSQ